MKIILASASPRRCELMKLITDDFIAVPAEIPESLPDDIMPEDAAGYLSELKAHAVAEKYRDSTVIGCDTVVICQGKILGKPADKDQCREYLRSLSGRSHEVITGCTIINNERKISFSVRTEVFFRNIDDNEIEEYIMTDEPYDKAGGYAIQGKGALFAEKISGDFYNVVGLPVSQLYTQLKNFTDTSKGEIK